MKRQEFSAAVRLAAWERSLGFCEAQGCGVYIDSPKLGPEYHHRIEAALGGEATIENCAVTCIPCHRRITAARAPVLAKVKRIRKARANIKPRRAVIPGSKASGWKKRMDGTVERRV